jgi:Ni/Co efflux regulator RcnB
MLRLGLLAGAVLIGAIPAAASAQMAGAPSGAPMQPGGWGHGGWQAGAPMPAGPNSGMHMAPPPGAWHGGGRPAQWHGDYHRPVRGWRMPRAWRDPSLTVADWRGWGFGEPGPGMRWVRYYNDAALVDGDGRVVDCRYGVDWDGGYAGARGQGYAPPPPGAYPPPAGAYPPPGYGYPAPGVTSYRAGPNTVVTTSVTPMGAPMVYTNGGCGACGGGAVVTVTPGMAVTTTTTTTDYETVYKTVAVRKKRAWHRPIRRYHPRCVRMTCPVQGS